MSTLKLQSFEGEVFVVDIEVAKQSITIKTMLEHINSDDDNGEEILKLVKVRSAILKKVIDWSEHHFKDSSGEDIPPVIKEPYHWPLPTDDISEWDLSFMDVDMGIKFEIIMAANFLEVKGLLDLACKSVANQIAGKSAVEMRKIFNVTPRKRISPFLNGTECS